MIRYINGDITKTEIKNIAHGVNCQNAMGSGVARALYSRFPNIKKAYHDFFNSNNNFPETKFDPLGRVLEVNTDGRRIFHLFTQNHYGSDGRKYVMYDAVVQCFDALNKQLKGQQLAIPKIGCGLAGGSWDVVKEIIKAYAPDIDIYVYSL
jgi:O-acetyl-ADP-ribose deacetylase (regulator of RNase III)